MYCGRGEQSPPRRCARRRAVAAAAAPRSRPCRRAAPAAAASAAGARHHDHQRAGPGRPQGPEVQRRRRRARRPKRAPTRSASWSRRRSRCTSTASSLDKNYAVIEQKLLSQLGRVHQDRDAGRRAAAGKDGLIETETRAMVKCATCRNRSTRCRKDERIEFIRNNGDPKISIADGDRATPTPRRRCPPARSQLAENVIKERIKSFGFRVWATEGETPTGAERARRRTSRSRRSEGEAALGEARRLGHHGHQDGADLVDRQGDRQGDAARRSTSTPSTPKAQSWATEDAGAGRHRQAGRRGVLEELLPAVLQLRRAARSA